MNIWFTSDTHMSHARILELGAGRPFRDIQHHNEMIIKNWNDVVSPEDTVYHLGDVALGPWPEGLMSLKRCLGRKILIPGNHDRIFSGESLARQERFRPDYLEVFDEILPEIVELDFGGVDFRVSHFPAAEVSIGGRPDRYVDKRPHDDGTPIIHGHTHQGEVVTHTARGTLQVSVGVDAWSWTPVPLEKVLELQG